MQRAFSTWTETVFIKTELKNFFFFVFLALFQVNFFANHMRSSTQAKRLIFAALIIEILFLKY